jgi:hypothetical protein
MLLYSRIVRTDATFDDRDDALAVDTTAADAAIAIPGLLGAGHIKPVSPIIKNWRGPNNVLVSAPDGTTMDGQRVVTLAPGQSLEAIPVFDENGVPEYMLVLGNT